jgi:hypothetical protein
MATRPLCRVEMSLAQINNTKVEGRGGLRISFIAQRTSAVKCRNCTLITEYYFNCFKSRKVSISPRHVNLSY